MLLLKFLEFRFVIYSSIAVLLSFSCLSFLLFNKSWKIFVLSFTSVFCFSAHLKGDRYQVFFFFFLNWIICLQHEHIKSMMINAAYVCFWITLLYFYSPGNAVVFIVRPYLDMRHSWDTTEAILQHLWDIKKWSVSNLPYKKKKIVLLLCSERLLLPSCRMESHVSNQSYRS